MNIEGKVVVITGASSGIGESTARLLAARGAKVALGARREDRIDALVKEITAKGGSAIGFKTDITKRGEVEALVKGAMDKYDRIDVIVNNAGIMPIAPMAALEVEEWNRMIDVNTTIISPGAVATELAESGSEEARENLRELINIAIPADSIARAIAYAIEQPAEVEIDEIVARPTAQDF